jgi:hypothetical protein
VDNINHSFGSKLTSRFVDEKNDASQEKMNKLADVVQKECAAEGNITAPYLGDALRTYGLAHAAMCKMSELYLPLVVSLHRHENPKTESFRVVISPHWQDLPKEERKPFVETKLEPISVFAIERDSSLGDRNQVLLRMVDEIYEHEGCKDQLVAGFTTAVNMAQRLTWLDYIYRLGSTYGHYNWPSFGRHEKAGACLYVPHDSKTAIKIVSVVHLDHIQAAAAYIENHGGNYRLHPHYRKIQEDQ